MMSVSYAVALKCLGPNLQSSARKLFCFHINASRIS